jgi:hypothetical protein
VIATGRPIANVTVAQKGRDDGVIRAGMHDRRSGKVTELKKSRNFSLAVDRHMY